MRLIVDECCSPIIGTALRNTGYDVQEIRDVAPGLDDHGVAGLARADRRLLVTHDRGFGDKAVRQGLLPDGVILLASPSGVTVAERTDWLLAAIEKAGRSLMGAFTVVDSRGVRSRRL